MSRSIGGWLLLLLCVLMAGVACAEELPLQRVSFGVERTREVKNDWVTANIGVTHEDADPAKLAERINQDMSWALDIAKAEEQVSVRTTGYRTFPVSDPKRGNLKRWRGGQDLVIEGSDARIVSELLGRLQTRLQLRGLQMSVARETRERVQEELIGEVLDAYRARAERIASRMGARGHTLVQLQLDTPGAPPPVPLRGRAMTMAAESITPPPIEGGTTTLRMGAHCTIALDR